MSRTRPPSSEAREIPAEQLWSAYQVYRGVVHRRALQEAGSVLPVEQLAEERAMVIDIWRDVMGG